MSEILATYGKKYLATQRQGCSALRRQSCAAGVPISHSAPLLVVRHLNTRDALLLKSKSVRISQKVDMSA